MRASTAIRVRHVERQTHGDGVTRGTHAALADSNLGWELSDVLPMAIMIRQPSMLLVPASSRFAKWPHLELPMHDWYLFNDKPAQDMPTDR